MRDTAKKDCQFYINSQDGPTGGKCKILKARQCEGCKFYKPKVDKKKGGK